MFSYFFHALPKGNVDVPLNDYALMVIIWVLLIPCTLWLLRFIYKSLRKTTMSYQHSKVYLCRDLFLDLGGFEYLIIVTLSAAVYFGFWSFYTNPLAANWLNWKTWVIAFPQISLFLTIVILFFVRYIKFRKPYIK